MSNFKSKMNFLKQKFFCYSIIYIASIFMINILLRNYVISSIISIVFSMYASKKFYEYKVIKNKRIFLDQFNEFLNSLSTSLVAGRNIYDSFMSAYTEMVKLYGTDSKIAIELKGVIDSYKNGDAISKKMMEIGNKSEIEDIKDFSQVFAIGSKYGGNLAQIISEAKNIIGEKISIEREIERLIIQKKYELMLMTFMPFLVVLSLKSFGSEVYQSGGIILISRLIVLFNIFLANRIGKKIIDIR